MRSGTGARTARVSMITTTDRVAWVYQNALAETSSILDIQATSRQLCFKHRTRTRCIRDSNVYFLCSYTDLNLSLTHKYFLPFESQLRPLQLMSCSNYEHRYAESSTSSGSNLKKASGLRLLSNSLLGLNIGVPR
jgi:hypothetical protein